MKNWIKPFGLLIVLILICSVIVRVTTGGETLSEYARKNPETAYATPDVTPMPEDNQPEAQIAAPSGAFAAASSGSPAATSQEAEAVTPGALAGASLDEEAQVSSSPSAVIAKEPENADSVHYQDGFFYQPLSDALIARITGISYPVSMDEADTLAVPAVNILEANQSPRISYDELCYLSVLYCDFNGDTQIGEIICNRGIAQDLVEIFYELYQNGYQIEKIRLIDEYNGDDTASMLDNNTSCFNYRVVDGTDNLSKHALGCAIDINPFYNPYVVFNKDGSGKTYISPSGSEIYADRSQNFPYKIDETDLCYKLFTQHGFIWGGNWNSCKDYQHFQKAVD